MSDAEETRKGFVRSFRHFAARLEQHADYHSDRVDLVMAFSALADLAERAETMPETPRILALMRVMEKAVARLEE